MDDKVTLPERPVAPSVNGDRQDPVERLDEATAALTALRDGLATEEPLDAVLQRLAEAATTVLQDADAVTICVRPEQPRTAAASDQAFAEIDERQFRANRGPCLESARTLTTLRAVVGENTDVWPEFEESAAQHGVRAYLSVPVVLPNSDRSDHQHVGSLNFYSFTAAAFDPFDEGLVRLFTTAASTAITNAHQWQRARDHVKHLETALVSRAVIEQAKGILMAVHSCTAEEAFDMLVQRSQNDNVKLRDVAKQLIDSLT